MKILTLTLNPAFDLYCDGDALREGEENFAAVTRCDAGGKGINIARALGACGVKAEAFVILGEENCNEFESRLKKDGVSYKAKYIHGRIRENITHRSRSGETRLSFSGFSITNEEFAECENYVLNSIKAGDILTLTGSLPKGVENRHAMELVKKAQGLGALVAVDCRNFSAEELKEMSPWLIKPNLSEIFKMTDGAVKNEKTALEYAVRLHRSGISNALISLGKDGAVLCCKDGLYSANAPEVKALSTIGAGDSMIAGFIYATQKGAGGADCLKYAVAFGSAACKKEGTEPPSLSDVEELLPLVTVKRH